MEIEEKGQMIKLIVLFFREMCCFFFKSSVSDKPPDLIHHWMDPVLGICK